MDTPDPTQDTITLKPRRVYKCDQDNRVMARKDVIKTPFGKFICPNCKGEVRDVTDTETGRDLMEIVCI